MTLSQKQTSFQLEDLRLLASLARAGSLAAAARASRVNHASAWRRLGALETRLGVRLFDRSRTGYQPTSAGEEAIAVAQRTLDGLVELERRLAGQDVRPAGPVRLTTTDTLLDLLIPALAKLRRSHPGILVELVTDHAFFTLTRRDADIALRPAATAPEGLVARRLAVIATAVYARPDASAGVLSAMDWVAPDESLAHLGAARWMAAQVPGERITLRASTLTALRVAARAGIGAAALPCFMGDPAPDLVRVLPPQPEMNSALWLLTHPDLRRTARIRVVLDMLAQHFVPLRRLLEGRAA
jgi:DNA-binding transcriptional LysR family regulator